MKNFLKGVGIGLGIVAILVAALYFFAPGLFIFSVVLFLAVAIFGVLVGYRLPEETLKKWSKAHGVPISEENRSLIVRYLTRGRRIRTSGALLGFIGYTIVTGEVARDEASWGVLRSIFFGYLIGAAVAELWALRLRSHGPASASLTPRGVGDYVPRGAIILLRVIAGATVLMAVLWNWIPERRIPGFVADQRPDIVWIAAWAGLSAGVVLFVEVVIRRIVRRPQPAVAVELVAVDDAIRSTSIHGMAGAGLALVLGIFSARAGDLASGGSLPPNLSALFGLLSLFSGIGSIAAWLHLGVDQPWVVRRSQPMKVAA